MIQMRDVLSSVCNELAKSHCDNEDNMKLRDGSLFLSLPGVQQQDRHADYDLDHPNAAKALIIMAYLSDNGKFKFYKDGKEHFVHSEKGDIAISL